MPKISIIVPVYKVEEYLPRCIDSILAQTFKDFELILIDDGSPDNCGKICDEYAKNDYRIKVLHIENGGVSNARNTGINEAVGEYISFVDSDDVIHPQYYEAMLKNADDADVVYCEYKKFTQECEFERIKNCDTQVYYGKDIFSNPSLSFCNVWNKIIRKNLLDNHRFDTNLKNAEDSLFAFDLLTKCNKVVYIKHQMYGYFIRQSGASISIDIAGKKNIVQVWKYILETSISNGYSIAEKKAKIFLLKALINLLYATEGTQKKEHLECKKYIRKNIFWVLFGKIGLSIKESIYLLYKLL